MGRFEFDPSETRLLEQSVIPNAIYQFIDKKVVTIALSQGYLDLFELTDREEAYHLMDEDMYRDTHPEDVARIKEAAVTFATQGGEYNVIYRSLIQGEYHIIHAFGKHFSPKEGVQLANVWYVDEGAYVGSGLLLDQSLVGNYSKILHDEEQEKKISYDSLTGLPNMTHFFNLAIVARDKVLAEGGHCAIGYANLNGLKHFNKKYGFAEGDKLLRGFASVLSKYFGSENSCRIGQDNYAFFARLDDLEKTLQNMIVEFTEMMGEKSLTVRIGIYTDLMGLCDSSLACDRARVACNTMRVSASSGYAFYNETMLAYENNYQYVIDNLDRALEERWIRAYYQPIVRAASGHVCDEEALARWIDPERGMLSPADFIPILEDSKLIYKVDLYMVDEIIRKFKQQQERGIYLVPVSVNLSRTDFDACDIVEEICERLDAANIPRNLLTIEITESVIGSDFGFMKRQVERFQELGFNVWMDDFGSGYSSLDLLQTIRFDLIKMDMRFMKQFDNSDKSKVIITELMKMAAALGIETISEGVERQDQVDFLREVGCTKLQGYFYSKPNSLEDLFKRYDEGVQIGFENPEESEYYATVGRVNLYDLSTVARENAEGFTQYFNTLPMGIVETNGEWMTLRRSNRSHREFLEKTAGEVIIGEPSPIEKLCTEPGSALVRAIQKCAGDGEDLYVEEHFGKATTVRAFVKRLATNPVTKVTACVIILLEVQDDKASGVTYADIANSLSADYINLYYVNLENEQFIEYRPDRLSGGLSVERHGENFFAESRKDADKYLYHEDVGLFVEQFYKENVLKEIDEQGSYVRTYRLLIKGNPIYVSMKAIRMSDDPTHLIVGVNNVDIQKRQQKALERMQEERTTYARISALTGNYICIYTVNPETDEYMEYGATEEYDSLNLAKTGFDFFETAKRESIRLIYEEDLGLFETMFTKEKVLEEVKANGVFILNYRILIDGTPIYTRLKAAMVEEKDGPQLIIGISNVDAQMRRDMEKSAG